MRLFPHWPVAGGYTPPFRNPAVHRLQLIVMVGFPSFSKTTLFRKGYWGNPSILKPPHSELTLTLTHFRNVWVRLELGISAQRIAVFHFGTVVFWGKGQNSSVLEWGVSEWRGVTMEGCRNGRASLWQVALTLTLPAGSLFETVGLDII